MVIIQSHFQAKVDNFICNASTIEKSTIITVITLIKSRTFNLLTKNSSISTKLLWPTFEYTYYSYKTKKDDA